MRVHQCNTALRLVREVCLDKPMKQIAGEWGIDLKTINYHWRTAKELLEFQSTVGAVLYAVHHNMIPPTSTP